MSTFRQSLLCSTVIFLLTLWFSSSVSANPCALTHLQSFQEGIGGTGKQPVKQEGVGGTGHADFLDGIGGTGHSEGLGGTGAPEISQKMTVVGVITGFASVCINGLEIHLDGSTKVMIDDELAAPEALKVGQVVRVDVVDIQGKLTASTMEIQHEVSGMVEAIDAASGIAYAAGKRLIIAEKTAGVSIASLSRGDNVKISGFRGGQDEVIVTRVERTLDTVARTREPIAVADLSAKTASLQGVVAQADDQGVRLVGWPKLPYVDKAFRPGVGDIVQLEVDNPENEQPAIIGLEKIEFEDIHERAGYPVVDYESDRATPERDNHGDVENQQREIQEIPEYERPEERVDSHEFEKPELPESPEHEAPEYEAPELPEAPEYEAPELPEAPEYEAPELPEAPEYEVPELPEAPEYEAPELPEPPEYEPPELPEAPEYEKPELPEYEPPELPEP